MVKLRGAESEVPQWRGELEAGNPLEIHDLRCIRLIDEKYSQYPPCPSAEVVLTFSDSGPQAHKVSGKVSSANLRTGLGRPQERGPVVSLRESL